MTIRQQDHYQGLEAAKWNSAFYLSTSIRFLHKGLLHHLFTRKSLLVLVVNKDKGELLLSFKIHALLHREIICCMYRHLEVKSMKIQYRVSSTHSLPPHSLINTSLSFRCDSVAPLISSSCILPKQPNRCVLCHDSAISTDRYNHYPNVPSCH